MVTDRKMRKLISEVVDRIKEKYEPEKIILYGSYAYGKPTEDSDIDLFIVKDTDKRRVDRYVEVSRLLAGREADISISPLVYSTSIGCMMCGARPPAKTTTIPTAYTRNL